MTTPKEVIEKFKNQKQELKDWLYGTVYKGYDQEEEAEVVQQDVEDHFTDKWFISTIISVLKEQEEIVESIGKETGSMPHFPGGQTEFRKRFRLEALSDVKLSLQNKIKEWEALQ